MTQPMANPNPEPTASTTGSTTYGGHAPPCSIDAAIIVVNATTDPTDRSIPPDRITNVMPTATTSRNPLSMKTFRITWPLENDLYWPTPTEYIATSRASVASTGT